MSGESDFLMIRPLKITNANLTSSSVAETDYGAYASGTTYALGDRVILVSPTSTVTISIAAPGVVTWVAHGQPVDSQIVFSTTGALPTGIVAGTIYYIVSVTADTFRISDVESGYPITTTGSQSGTHTATVELHKVFESLQATNTGHYPTLAASSTWWLEVQATNRWTMFDQTYGSQTKKADTIVVSVTPGEIVNSVFLGNIDAASVTVAQTVSGFSRTVSLNSHDVLDWYAWYYEDVIRKHDYSFLDIPPYVAGVLTVTIDNTGDTAACGICVVGKSVKLGTTQWGMRGGVISYSGTTTNGFGQTTFVKRANAKKLNLDVQIASGFESEAHRLLSLYLDTPIAFIGASEYAIAQVWGSIASFDVPVSDTGETAPLEIRGLT